jgi:type IV pilus assembly protein PilN
MIRINLLPVRVSKKKEAGRQQLVFFALVIVFGLVANFIWNRSRAGDLEARETRLKKTRDDIAKLERTIGEVKDIKTEQAALKEKLEVLEKLKAGRNGPVRVLDELATITPKRLWFKKINEDKGGTMVFEGSALTIDDVSALLKALKESRYFASGELKKTTARKEGKFKVVDFTITSNVNYTPTVATAAAATSSPSPPAPPAK